MKNLMLTLIAFTVIAPFQGVALAAKPTPKSLHKQAMEGSAAAAKELAEANFKDNPQMFQFWACVAAENGDVDSQYNCGRSLVRSQNQLLKARGIYWLRKAAKNGNEHAPEVLAEVGA